MNKINSRSDGHTVDSGDLSQWGILTASTSGRKIDILLFSERLKAFGGSQQRNDEGTAYLAQCGKNAEAFFLMVKSMDQFLQYENELAPGSGFALWSLPHILWLLVLSIIAAVALLEARHCEGRGKRWIRRTFATCALLMQILPALLIMWKGMYSKYTLPLHICSLASYAVFVHAFIAERSVILSELLFFPFLPGAVCALLFPDWTMYPPCSFFSSAGFLVHGAIIIYILLCLDERIIAPTAHRWPIVIVFLVLYAGIIIPFDRAFGVNYGFLNNASPGSPLVWLADTFGAGIGYYASYGAAVIVVMAMWYGVWVARHRL